MSLSLFEGLNSALPTDVLFDIYHRQLKDDYRDRNNEYYASCRSIAIDLAGSLLRAGQQPSFLRLRPDTSVAPYLRPSVYSGQVEWTSHVAAMDEQGGVLDPMLPHPIPYDEYIGSQFMDDNVTVYEIIEGEAVQQIVDAEKYASY